MGQTLVEKIAQAHLATASIRPLRAGDFVTLRPARLMTHDNTSAVMSKLAALGVERLHDPAQLVFALDHDIQNRSPENLGKYRRIEAFAQEHGVTFYPAGRGIGHQLMVEQLHVLPGELVVASDSHANTYGALGAVGTPVVRSDAAAIWATGELWWQIPPTVQVVLAGELGPGVSGKDVIVTLCGQLPEEVLNCSLELGGSGVADLDIEARLTIANMTTEWGALSAWFPADEVTFRYLDARRQALGELGRKRLPDDLFERLRAAAPRPDDDAVYAARIHLDLGTVTPSVAGPDDVARVTSAAELGEARIAIDKAYLISCVNAREGDLAAAAEVLRGQRVAPGVQLYVAAASSDVEARSRARGSWQALLDAGAIALPAGCGPCIGLGAGLLGAGEVGISTTNRNFKGRMGSPEARCYLASPRVVAASARAGYICAPTNAEDRPLACRYERLEAPAPATEPAALAAGFPAVLSGRLLLLPRDHLNTDGIYPGSYTYREGVTRAEMAEVVMRNYDPGFAGLAGTGDILLAGHDFGTGSSREQAATALLARGIALVVAASLSQTFVRNALNNGLACVVSPALYRAACQRYAAEVAAGQPTIATSERATVDFARHTIAWGTASYPFEPLGAVAQALVAAGGIEAELRRGRG